jgi:hypothetical protein
VHAGNARRAAQVYLGSTLLTSCGVAHSGACLIIIINMLMPVK